MQKPRPQKLQSLDLNSGAQASVLLLSCPRWLSATSLMDFTLARTRGKGFVTALDATAWPQHELWGAYEDGKVRAFTKTFRSSLKG